MTKPKDQAKRDLEHWRAIEEEFDATSELEDRTEPDQGKHVLDRPMAEQFVDLVDSAMRSHGQSGLSVGDHVGAYRISARVGEGGMGKVFQATRDDGNFDQVVALKVLHRGPADEQAHHRFVQERQILAGLRHPNIARLLDGGVVQSSPYLVMEYIEGEAITEYCTQNHLGPEQRIQLFLQVAAAIRYAHKQGIVHRDIKPSNLLIEQGDGERARAVVLDFGIALIEDGSKLVTSTGQVMGTPGYMSPEQSVGERTQVDRRTDIFSLGVILYQLLTDRRPFEGSDIGSVLVAVLHEEPIPIQRHWPSIPADLATIVHTCLERDPGGRYPSVRALENDLKCYLDGSPITARPIGLTARWLRRARQRPKTAALVVCLIAVLLTSVAAFALVGIKHARALESERNLAVAARQEAEGLMDFMLADLHQGLDKVGRLDLLLDVAQRTLVYYAGHPEIVSIEDLKRRSLALVNAGQILEEQGRIELALNAYQQDQVALTDWLSRTPAADLSAELIRNHNAMAGAYIAGGDIEEALRETKVGLAKSNQRIRAADTTNRDAKIHFESLTLRGWVLREAGNIDEAMSVLSEAESLARVRSVVEPKWRHDHAVALSYIGLIHYQQGDLRAALEYFLPARGICEALVAEDPSNTVWREELQLTLGRIGSTWLDLGDNSKAESALNEAGQQSDILVTMEPANANWLRELAVVRATLAAVYLDTGKLDEALANIQGSLQITQTLIQRFPDNHSIGNDLAWDLLDYGRALDRLGRTEEAKQAWRDALQAIKKVREHEPSAHYYMDTEVQILLESGNIDQARPLVNTLVDSGWKAPDFIELVTKHGLIDN